MSKIICWRRYSTGIGVGVPDRAAMEARANGCDCYSTAVYRTNRVLSWRYASSCTRVIQCVVAFCCILVYPPVSNGQAPPARESDRQDNQVPQQSDANRAGERELFWDGSELEKWNITKFGTESPIAEREGVIELSAGYPLTGIHATDREWPVNDFEIEWEFQRVVGTDFPSCLTFPVGDSHCSFVIGGWGGALVGLSCIDDQDAAHNPTMSHIALETGKWYIGRIRVTSESINCWIDRDQVVSQSRSGSRFSVRNEVRLSRPLGICSFETTALIRNFRVYKLKSDGADDH